jgi:hypothetical protein
VIWGIIILDFSVNEKLRAAVAQSVSGPSLSVSIGLSAQEVTSPWPFTIISASPPRAQLPAITWLGGGHISLTQHYISFYYKPLNTPAAQHPLPSMMASFMSYFGARKDPKQSARDAIVTLRQQLQMLEKKEEHLQKKIDEELKKAKANAVSNKTGEWWHDPFALSSLSRV